MRAMVIKLKHISFVFQVLSIICMIFYCLFFAYLMISCREVFVNNANATKDAFGPLWCGTDINSLLSLTFNLILPLHLGLTLGLFALFAKKELSALKLVFFGTSFVIYLFSLLTLGYWLYANYLGRTSFGQDIWWI